MHAASSPNALEALEQRWQALSAATFARFKESTQASICTLVSTILSVGAALAPMTDNCVDEEAGGWNGGWGCNGFCQWSN